MKHTYTFLSCAAMLCTTPLMAQSTGTNVLDFNNVSALFHSNGLISLDQAGSSSPYFFVPKTPSNNGPSTLFAAGLWIGGMDTGNQLHFAGERFEQVGWDFFPGPLGTDASITPATSAQFDQVWKVNQSDVAMQMAIFIV